MEARNESNVIIKKQLQNCWNWLGINAASGLKQDKSIRETENSIIQHFAQAGVRTIPKTKRANSLFEESVTGSKEELEASLGTEKLLLPFGGGSTLMPPEFADDIDSYLRWLEDKNALKFGYLSRSFQCNGLHGGMRQLLVDWILQLKRTFSLTSETISLAIFVLDRALMQMAKSLTKQNLQLVGTASLLIACKYEEIIVPRIADFAYMTKGTFTPNQILQMEQSVLQAVDYQISCAHSIQFMRRYRYYMQVPKQVYNLAKFISEVALVFYPLAHYKPSIVAAVSLYLASVAHTLSIVSTVYSNCLRLDEREVVSVACKFVPFVLEMAAPNGKYHALYDNFKKVAGLPLSNDQINRLKLLLD